ncbi:MAG TPA: cytidylate kinase family protein, partial [Chthoniobacterales bacterium]
NETMKALAHRGRTVILGRGGYASLNEYEDVLNVRLQAPFPIRVERVMTRGNTTNRLRAEEEVKEDDKARQKFVELFYNKQWDIGSDFDLVINTNIVSTEMASEWIIEAVRALEQKEFAADAVTAQRAKVDPILLDAINEAFERSVTPFDKDL